jgi:hypothetical protein
VSQLYNKKKKIYIKQLLLLGNSAHLESYTLQFQIFHNRVAGDVSVNPFDHDLQAFFTLQDE